MIGAPSRERGFEWPREQISRVEQHDRVVRRAQIGDRVRERDHAARWHDARVHHGLVRTDLTVEIVPRADRQAGLALRRGSGGPACTRKHRDNDPAHAHAVEPYPDRDLSLTKSRRYR